MVENGYAYAKRDKAMLFNSKYKKLKLKIQGLEKAGFNLELFNEDLNLISRKLEANLVNASSSSAKKTHEDCLSFVYESAYNEIVNLENNFDQQYGEYVKIIQSCDKIDNILVTGPGESDFNNLVDDTIQVLTDMKSSPTEIYNIESNLVYRVYKIVYEVIKIELLFSNTARLYTYVKNDEMDIINITEFLKADFNQIKDDFILDNTNLSNINIELDPYRLFDADLIRLIALLKKTELREAFIDAIEKNKNELENLNDDISKTDEKVKLLNNDLDDNNDDYNQSKRNFRIARFKASFLALFMTACLPIGYKTADVFGKSNTYIITTTTYDSETGKEKSSEERSKWKYHNDPSHVIITETTQWYSYGYFREYDNGDAYSREIYTYELPSDLVSLYDEPSEYLTSNLRGKLEVKKSKNETSPVPPDDFGYVDSKYTVTKYDVDFASLKKTKDPILFASVFASFGVLDVLVFLYFIKYKNGKYKILLERKNEAKKDLNETKNDIDSNKNALYYLRQSRHNLEELTDKQEKVINSLSLVKKRK